MFLNMKPQSDIG